jgi:hypothetical protein
MARRKSEQQSMAVLVLGGIVMAVFACLAFLIPVAGLGAELCRLSEGCAPIGFPDPHL